MLIGVSLGPGDPGLLTLKAVEVLSKSEAVFVPGELARELASPYCRPIVLEFPMIEDEGRLEHIWARNADIVAKEARRGQAAFACIGDVNTFSTFTHLKRLILERHPGTAVESIPGVCAACALAARLGVGLERSFLVSDGSSPNATIRLKATRPAEIALSLQREGFDEFALGSRLYSGDEKLIRGEMPEKSGYFSVLYARKRGTHGDQNMMTRDADQKASPKSENEVHQR
ncbi:MAG: cobalt-factor II C(20)-methyltransferase [Methanotrichaceae archaeon]|nr:cobalt-factor II C(20)-methyltransferase [Methanotrichaceae archaeon]